MRSSSLPALAPLALAALALAACGGPETLKPAPTSQTAEVRGKVGVYGNQNGVRVVATENAWHARPYNLDIKLTPILVKIVNRSHVPVAIDYSHFRLKTAGGDRFQPLPPYDIDASIVQRVRPYYPWTGFAAAPYLAPYYGPGSVVPETEPFGDRPLFYRRYYPELRRIQLPTPAMVTRALPEGVVRPGGTVEGFLYFRRLPSDAGRATLDATLVNAKSRATIAALALPFIATD